MNIVSNRKVMRGGLIKIASLTILRLKVTPCVLSHKEATGETRI